MNALEKLQGPADLEAGFRVDQPEPGRPLELDCRLCGRRFHVAARGRIPKHCRGCNRRAASPRPSAVACADCGCVFSVASKGPLPERCPECSHRAAQRRYRASRAPRYEAWIRRSGRE